MAGIWHDLSDAVWAMHTEEHKSAGQEECYFGFACLLSNLCYARRR